MNAASGFCTVPMARRNDSTTQDETTTRGRRPTVTMNTRHEHRTAKIVELIGTSTRSFEDAVKVALADAAETTRGITGAQVEGFSVKCADGKITEYKANVRVAFGIERT
jgi:dodecin